MELSVFAVVVIAFRFISECSRFRAAVFTIGIARFEKT
jgi:hypothetical protein